MSVHRGGGWYPSQVQIPRSGPIVGEGGGTPSGPNERVPRPGQDGDTLREGKVEEYLIHVRSMPLAFKDFLVFNVYVGIKHFVRVWIIKFTEGRRENNVSFRTIPNKR